MGLRTSLRISIWLFCVLVTSAVWAQTPRATASTAYKSTAPVKLRIWVEKNSKEVTFIGRTETAVQLASSVEGSGGARLEIANIQRAEFDLDYDRMEVAKSARYSEWRNAIRIMQPVLEKALPYLDIEGNNAAEPAMELGTYMMRAAARTDRTATNEVDRALSKKQYEAAYEVFKACARVSWSSIGQLGVMKGCHCLLALDKPKTARFHLDQMDEPTPGDAVYGHYWLLRAELLYRAGQFRDAMNAAVKSVCFENKDVETFPDALLMTARCYEELLEPYRARDVYYEVAKLFPRSDWCDNAVGRLRLIMASGKTKEKEVSNVENVFFKTADDMNELVEQLFKDIENPVNWDDDDGSNVPQQRINLTGRAAPPPEEE